MCCSVCIWKRESTFSFPAHREENIDIEANFISLMTAINHMAESYRLPVIYSTHPRSMKFIQSRNFKFHPLVQNVKPLGLFDYNHLQMNSLCGALRQRHPQ